jgi:hypothetical protein
MHPFGKSDRDSFCSSLPIGRNSNRSFKRWSDQSDSTLQDYFDHTDWDMFSITRWRRQRWSPGFTSLGNYAVFCFLMYYFLHCYPRKYCLISWEELLTENTGINTQVINGEDGRHLPGGGWRQAQRQVKPIRVWQPGTATVLPTTVYQCITGDKLPAIQDIFSTWCHRKAKKL